MAREPPRGNPGGDRVEMCGSESGHVAGMLLASILPPGAAREVVLVDARWPADAHSSSSSSLPVAHVDTPPVPGTYRAQLTRWKATAKNASHLRSLHRALRGATAGDAARARRGVPSRAGDGCTPRHADVLRSRARTRRARPRTARPLRPRRRHQRKTLYRAGPSHTFTARQIYPREGRRRDRRRSARDVSSASASDSPERRFARHLAVASGGATENVDARPIVASRNAGDEVRTPTIRSGPSRSA